MTGPELRAALAALGLPQRRFGRRFGISAVSVNAWCAGRVPVPPWVPPVLDLLRREHEEEAEWAEWAP
jgi:transcriptional regulator with XRE-family HTH domain